MTKRKFEGGYITAARNDDSGDVTIEFFHARHFTQHRFMLLESERDRFDDADYIEGLVRAYHRDPDKFGLERKLTQV